MVYLDLVLAHHFGSHYQLDRQHARCANRRLHHVLDWRNDRNRSLQVRRLERDGDIDRYLDHRRLLRQVRRA